MRLAPLFRLFAGPLVAAAACVASADAAEDRGVQLLAIGPVAGIGPDALPDAPPDTQPDGLLALDRLPAPGGVETALYGATLRAEPVTHLSGDRPAPVAARATEALVLALGAELAGGEDGPVLLLNTAEVPLTALGARLAETLAAFDAATRPALFVGLTDRDGSFAEALPGLRAALDPLGFGLTVLMVAPAGRPVCEGAPALPLSIASGFADLEPFGNGDGATALGEAEAYIDRAVRRGVARGCGPAYAVIYSAGAAPDDTILAQPLPPGALAQSRFDRERFRAMFLASSADRAALADYLATCAYCPGEAALGARLAAMAADTQAADLEDEIWREIRDDDSRERLAVYLDNCTLCTHRAAAQSRVATLDAATAAATAEAERYATAEAAGDLAALRTYVAGCVTCAHKTEAEALIAEVEGSAAFKSEQALLTAALAEGDGAGLDRYLADCVICDGADQARAERARLASLDTYLAPCVAAAGLPQMGGPRKFEDIDQGVAIEICADALDAFPENGLLRTLGGRISQGHGDRDAADAAYAFGMEQGVPAAFGLAAFNAYTPADGGAIDPLAVEELALAGAAKGDWLSREVLAVLYSKDLVPGKSGPEALALAQELAGEGNALAQFLVGQFHLTGLGTAPSDAEAAKWFETALAAGYTPARPFLAGLYERGSGVPVQPDRAAELYWAALGQGNATARQQLTTDLAQRSEEVVRNIQRKLQERGLYTGALDGLAGPGTEAAIRAYLQAPERPS